MRARGSGLQSIYLLSRGFQFIINCSDCNWLQTAISNYSQTPLFYLLLLKVKLYYDTLKKKNPRYYHSCVLFSTRILSLFFLNGSKRCLFVGGHGDVTVGVGGGFLSVTGEVQMPGKLFGGLC